MRFRIGYWTGFYIFPLYLSTAKLLTASRIVSGKVISNLHKNYYKVGHVFIIQRRETCPGESMPEWGFRLNSDHLKGTTPYASFL